MRTLRIESLRLVVAAAAAFLLTLPACSSSKTEPDAVACVGEGCPCIFAVECPDGMQCVNGLCSTENPFPEDLRTGDGVADAVGDAVEPDFGPTDQVVEPEVITDLPFGAGCSENAQCASLWCVDSPDGGYCTMLCSEGCPEGWTCKAVAQTSPDYINICVLDKARLCLPCETDLHCGDAGDLCLNIGGGTFCGRDCTLEPCPTGYHCQEVEKDGETWSQCLPLNGSCDCGPDNAGQVRGCQVTNDIGTCFGQETCDPESGWVDCTASVPEGELCDGKDNDCNGQVDEGQEPTACDIENEYGKCSGTSTCQGAAGWVCSALTPGPELCNGLDDDCDGELDEEFIDEEGNYLTVNHCGTCGNSCVAKFEGAAEVACQLVGGSPTCVIVACEPGYFLYNELTCLDENAFLCQPCNVDSDCFGDFSKCLQVSETDPRTFCARDCSEESPFSPDCPNGFDCENVADGQYCMPTNDSCDCTEKNAGQTKACSLQNEFGICFGSEVCDPALGWTGCSATVPEEESCDGIDNDCDGMLDEETASGAECAVTNAFGTCLGVEICLAEEGLQCSAPQPAEEVCDGLDNDCDGDTDEGYALAVGDPPVLKYGLLVEHCGACDYACPEVSHGTPACNAEPAVPACVVGSCDEGYYPFQDAACVPIPDANLCTPCKEDADCQGPNDRCIPYSEAQGYCARDCGPGSIYETDALPCPGTGGEQGCCPDGYLCMANGADRQCLPLSGSCTCVEDGKVDACVVSNQWGTCYGLRTCELDGDPPGWSDCTAVTPQPELCDTLDNDCDGLLDAQDDSLDLTSTPTGGPQCSTGPACNGTWHCSAGGWKCSAQAATPEACDGLDNDCDGQVDEDFLVGGLYGTPAHCGACGYDCEQLVPHSDGPSCKLLPGGPTCIAEACDDGYFPYGGGIACMALPDNLCQPCGSDADCLVPSSRCVTIGVESFCARDCGPQSPYGAQCPVGYECTAVAGDEQCLPLSQSCVCSGETEGLVRSCTAGACTGKQTCVEQEGVYGFTECSAEGVIPEVCDGQDNDCDGEADEGFLSDGGLYVDDENCGVCGNNCLVQVSEAVHHAVGGCDAGSVPPQCVVAECTLETQQGVDYEWVDINGILDDGCECRRVKGNTGEDEPDLLFFPDGGVVPGYPEADSPYEDANCDGLDGVLADALFVSASNPFPGDGSLDAPYQTIGEALDAFPASGKAYILVSGGVYQENVVLFPGARLHGGYSTDFKKRNIVLFTTEIRGVQPGPGDPPGTVNAEGITGSETVLSGFAVVGRKAPTGVAAGANSYALYVLDSDESLELRNNWVVAGTGGAGGTGVPGSNGFGSQSAGGNALKGTNGSPAGGCLSGNCNNASQPGGSGGSNGQCPQANGHTGGGVTCPVYNQPSYVPSQPGHDGEPGYSWTLDSGSSGSCGSHATEAGYPAAIKKLDGGDGHDGSDGTDGQQGTGCGAASGSFVNGEWTGQAGATGATGSFGQPGGSGGSSGGIDTASAQEMPLGVNPYWSARYKLGATGGGGGAGGCGGTGGGGGHAGGASLAVVVAYSVPGAAASAPVVAANQVERGLGGAGGSGAYGGQGGLGGVGGLGGDSQSYWIDFKAGSGGRGGRGGEGGGGGGGCGGASYAIAAFGVPAGWNLDYGTTNEFLTGDGVATGGAGGPAGASGGENPAGKGTDGTSANLHVVAAP